MLGVFGCKQALLCGTHKGVLCTACDEPANEAPAAQPSNALPSHFVTMLTCLMPGGGELLTAHYAAVPFDASPVTQDTTLAPSDCPFRVQHEDLVPVLLPPVPREGQEEEAGAAEERRGQGGGGSSSWGRIDGVGAPCGCLACCLRVGQ